MDKKCSKYEGLFIFSTDEALKQHLEECEECRLEHEKMQKVSGLLDEVKFYYRAKRNKKRTMLKAVCAMSLLLFSTLMFAVINDNDELLDTLRYGEDLSIEDLGFPVDSYGLLMVDE